MGGARRMYRRGAVAVIVGAVIVLTAAPWATAVAAPAVAPAASSPAVPVPGVGATVRWDGANIATAGSASAALLTSFTHTIDVIFTWVALDGSTGPNLYNISTARLQFFYFGASLDTRDVVDSSPALATNGSFDMQWQPGVFQYLFEGTFGLTASLIAPNGTTMWSEPFYIHAQAPAAILAALPIVLVLIAVYEAYGLATAGRQAGVPTAKVGGATPRKPGAPEPDDARSEKDPEGPGR